MRISLPRVGGVITSTVIALGATVLMIDFLAEGLGPNDWSGWHIVAPLAVFGAWTSVLAWAADRRLLAVPGHLASLFAPWGFLYPFPLAAITLAIVAGATFRSARASQIRSS